MAVRETGQSYRFIIHYIVEDSDMPLFEKKLWQGLQKLANEGVPPEVFEIAQQAVSWRIDDETTAEHFHQWVTRQIIKRFKDEASVVSYDDIVRACWEIRPETVTLAAKTALLKNRVFNTHMTIENDCQSIARTIYDAMESALITLDDIPGSLSAKELK